MQIIKDRSQLIFWLVATGLLLWTGLFFLQRTNLAASDLGRHITNGRIIVETRQVFNNNLYSYTNSQFHAPNHHWLFGVISYWWYQWFGFSGLTLLSAFVYTSAIGLVLVYFLRQTSFWPSIAAFLLVLPLYANRYEVRPEAFSLLFFSLLLVLFHHWLHKTSLKSYLTLMIVGFFSLALWVNLHIFFILTGILGLAAFFHLLVNRQWRLLPHLFGLAFFWGIATLINPLFIEGATYPFVIFSNYGYRVAENQPIWFFLQHFTQPIHWYLIVVVALLLIATGRYYWRHYRQHTYLLTISLILLFLTSYMIRFHNLLALSLLPSFAIAFHAQRHLFVKAYEQVQKNNLLLSAAGLAGTFIVIILFTNNLIWPFKSSFGLGLLPNYFQSTDFLKETQPAGQMFNNFDSGSFLIFTLYPDQKVFVDNRAEAYPDNFLQNEYIAAQQDEAVWEEIQQKYDLGYIVYYRHDMTNWGQEFLVKRFNDPAWVPVYVDNYMIIFVKDTPANQQLIANHRLPDELFSVSN